MYEFTSESVSSGHPDKIADKISDAVATYLIDKNINHRAAVETLVTTNMVTLAGEYKSDKFDKELRRVIDATPYLNCKVEAGELEPSRNATIRLDEDKFSDRARPDGMKGMYIPEYKDET